MDNEHLRDQIELLAEYAHKAWSQWMIYVFSKCVFYESGDAVIPADLVERWKRQMSTPYKQLPEDEKLSDRVEAAEMLRIIAD